MLLINSLNIFIRVDPLQYHRSTKVQDSKKKNASSVQYLFLVRCTVVWTKNTKIGIQTRLVCRTPLFLIR